MKILSFENICENTYQSFAYRCKTQAGICASRIKCIYFNRSTNLKKP